MSEWMIVTLGLIVFLVIFFEIGWWAEKAESDLKNSWWR